MTTADPYLLALANLTQQGGELTKQHTNLQAPNCLASDLLLATAEYAPRLGSSPTVPNLNSPIPIPGTEKLSSTAFVGTLENSALSQQNKWQQGLATGQTYVPIANQPLAWPASLDEPPNYYFVYQQPLSKDSTLAQFSTRPSFDVQAVRRDFPLLQETVNGYPLVWFDNAATTQKPKAVIDRITRFYQQENSNIHRAAHTLAARATDAYEDAREQVSRFINAPSSNTLVFVRGATEAINLVAQSWGQQCIGVDDEIIISWLEHHANIVPWQQLCAKTGAVLRVIPVTDNGQINLTEYQKLLNKRTKLVAITQVSNALGTITPVQAIIELAHRVGAKVLLDGAQSIAHIKIDVQQLDCDWFVFSGHKVFAPTGIGVLYGKAELLEASPPWQGGGNMIENVSFEDTTYQAAPAKFEAGTGNIADAVGLGAALAYLDNIGIDNITRYEHELLQYGIHCLRQVPGLTLIGTATEKASVLSFVLAGHSTLAVAQALDKVGIAVRAGHHCAQPILKRFGVDSTVRPSLAFYNTYEEIDRLVVAIKHLQKGKYSYR
ncbi:MAG: family 2A encapsulin nanocompartment cargo protein cysteine desulfurase [Methylococcaceae bacterium]|jgi:cysteine desulfurase/selenocysteine lyase